MKFGDIGIRTGPKETQTRHTETRKAAQQLLSFIF